MKWPFGTKHKGKELSKIPSDYLQWVVKESHTKGTLFTGTLIQEVVAELSTRSTPK